MTLLRVRAAARQAAVAAFLLAAAAGAGAQEAAIRKALAERIPKMPPIDEVRPTPIPGLFEVRYAGSDILYSDEKGEYILVNGSMVETRTRTDLTEARIDKLIAVDFAKLPVKDAIVIRQGRPLRKVAVFVDPNCGYCKHFERDLAGIKDVLVYTFLLPILGPDSQAKSRDIWCAKDSAKAWRAWMLEGIPAPAAAGAPASLAKCDVAALERNLEFGRRHKINGTPAVLFEDGTRRPGAIPADALEKLLVAAAASKK
jgi:thiol:disulfide interchange protein DsbC